MKKIFRLATITIMFLCLTFNMRVVLAQDNTTTTNPGGTTTGTDNGTTGGTTNGTLNGTNNGTTNGTTGGTTNNGTTNGTANNGTYNGTDNNTDLLDNDTTDNNDNLGKILTYGGSGVLLGGLITYFAFRDKRTV